jgi:hypothetical protein
MSGAHEGCSQGKSVRDREGSKHSTAATPERVDSEAAMLPQDFEDTVHARQLKALCRRVGRRMSRQGPGRSPSMGLTHLNAARPREKSSGVPHCGSSKILSDLVSHRRATRLFGDSLSGLLCIETRTAAAPRRPAGRGRSGRGTTLGVLSRGYRRAPGSALVRKNLSHMKR